MRLGRKGLFARNPDGAGRHRSTTHLGVRIDINSDAIATAQQGCCAQRAVHNTGDKTLQRYFHRQETGFCVRTETLCPVHFHVANLFDDSLHRLGRFEIIFCRNVLIYFDETFHLRAAEKLAKLLAPGGRLYVGHADLLPKQVPLQKIFEENAATTP